MPDPADVDRLSLEDACHVVDQWWGIPGDVQTLPGYDGQNFHVAGPDGEFVLKVAHGDETEAVLDLQHAALLRVRDAGIPCPEAQPSRAGRHVERVRVASGEHLVRVLTFMPGTLYAHAGPHPPTLLRDLGHFVGRVDRALAGLRHDAALRHLIWDVRHAQELPTHTIHIDHAERRRLAERCLEEFAARALSVADQLRTQVIHGDANDYNLLVEPAADGAPRLAGIFDFGDVVETYLVCELAIACAYAVQGQMDVVAAACDVIRGYHEVLPLEPVEVDVLPEMIRARLCTTVIMAAREKKRRPDNLYLGINEESAWRALEQFAAVDVADVRAAFQSVCSDTCPADACPAERPEPGSPNELLESRRQRLGAMLSVSYRTPLHIVRGSGPYLFDSLGRAYLDVVNNVCHVGHCHPHVVAAGERQLAVLNTNTRYLHENVVRYAERLTATMPAPLDVVIMVNSGSEANDLALRLARAHTGGRDVIVVGGAYHGNLGSLIELSPYKFDAPGGAGRAAHVHEVPMPDPYRGPHRRGEEDLGTRYAAYVRAVADAARGPSTFLCESILGCGGQIVLPDGYLQAAFESVRAAGGVCVADEVQVGFGRVGTHMWAFETQGVVPDIVTLGKPMGNGHPVAAVVTTAEIAASFDPGMEYFNTFGGNPVSCAIASAVLDVIEDEGLQQNALDVGAHLLAGLQGLAERTPLIGDVRGRGLFLGVELVRDRETQDPAASEAEEIVERMKDRGVLLSTDGPLHNVLKMKPPLVFRRRHADLLLCELASVLAEVLGREG